MFFHYLILIFNDFGWWLHRLLACAYIIGCEVTLIFSNGTFLFVSIHYKMGISSLHFFVSSLHLDVRNITNCTRCVMKNVRNAQKMPIPSGNRHFSLITYSTFGRWYDKNKKTISPILWVSTADVIRKLPVFKGVSSCFRSWNAMFLTRKWRKVML